jgi:peptide chain release factor 1
MYTMYADSKRWKTEVANLNETELGALRRSALIIIGEGAIPAQV